MMKHTRITAAAAAFLMLSGICGSVPQKNMLGISVMTVHAQTEGDFEYEIILDDTMAVVTKYIGTDDTVVIPDTLGGVPVIDIEEDAFPDKEKLKKVTLPESMTWCFPTCFRDCVNLEEVHLSSETELLGDDTFSGCTSLKKIDLPDTLITIGARFFKNCKSLTEIRIPANCFSIGEEAFSGCENLKTIEIPEAVETFEYEAFAGTAWLKEQQAKNPAVVVNSCLIDGSACKGNVVIPDGVQQITYGAFKQNQIITGITFPESLHDIEREAFRGCSGLTELTIPKSLSYLSDKAFADCENLKKITLPDELSRLDDYAFANCKALTQIRLPQHLSNIPEGVFSGCENLSQITFPEWLFTADKDAFKDTAWLKAQQETDPCVVYNETLIDVSACKGTLVLPDTVSAIGRGVISDNGGLTSIIFPKSYDYFTYNLINNCPNLREIVFLTPTIRTLPRGTIHDCSNLISVTLPETVYEIENDAISFCDKLGSLYIPDTVIKIEKDAFYSCPNLILKGKSGSYAEQYAAQNNIPFHAGNKTTGPDLNGDGICDHADVKVLQAFLTKNPVPLANWLSADLNRDGVLNAADLTLFKQYLLQ